MTATRILPQNTDYTDKDFDSIRARLFALIATVFPEWTDDSVANFGNILVELFAFSGDVLTFYQDRQAGESRIATAKLRRSLIGLCKLIGYSPKLASAATVTETFTTSSPITTGASFTLPAGTKVRSAEVTAPVFYQLLQDLVWAEGQQTKQATVENSEFASSTFASSGLANQAFALPSTPFLTVLDTDGDTVADAVVAGNGTFTQVLNFLSSKATDKHFVVVVDQNDRATIIFGNGVNGAIPAGNVTIDYKIGGGKAGRVNAGALSILDAGLLRDSLGNVVTVSVTNAAASSGGDDRETNAQIAVNGPESIRVLGRAVAREDYEIAAQTVPGVARSLHVTSNEVVSIGENQGILFIVPTDGGTASGALLTSVSNLFLPTGKYPKTNTYNLTVQTAPYLVVNVSATIYLKPGFAAATVKANVTAALQAFFAIMLSDGSPNPDINFGYYFQDEDGNPTGVLAFSDAFNAVRDAVGVGRVDPGASGFLLNGERQDLEIGVSEFPKLGTITLINGATGAQL